MCFSLLIQLNYTQAPFIQRCSHLTKSIFQLGIGMVMIEKSFCWCVTVKNSISIRNNRSRCGEEEFFSISTEKFNSKKYGDYIRGQFFSLLSRSRNLNQLKSKSLLEAERYFNIEVGIYYFCQFTILSSFLNFR